MENFNTLGLPESLLNSLNAMNFSKPTLIQAQTIPSALEGKDILGSAQTGTGKTGAFGIPLVSHILNSANNNGLILTPTRELAAQVLATIKQMIGKSNIKTALLIGGEPIVRQFNQLKASPRIIVGTPGRVNDHLIRGTLNLAKSNFFVLDEFDRMLDMGFSIQLEKIENYLPKTRQTLMFSATIANDILKLANSYLIDPVRVAVGSTNAPMETIKQELVKTTENEKYDILLDKLNQNNGSVIIFVKTKFGTEKLAKRLQTNGHDAQAIHGDLRQHKRDRVIKAFRDRKNRILVATDVAARGLDINHVECVINHDLPQCADDYVHRIGRTGRAGAEGIAISLVTPQDGIKWKNISKLINPNEKHAPEASSGKRRSDNSRRSEGSFYGDRKPKRNNDKFSFDAPKKKYFGDKSFSNDKPNSYAGDRPRGYASDKPNSYAGDRPRGYSNDKPNSYAGDRPRGYSNDKPNGYASDRPRSYSNDKPNSYAGEKPRGYASDKPRSYSNDKPNSYNGEKPRGYASDKPRGYSNDKPNSYNGEKPRGYAGDKPRSYSNDKPKNFNDDKPKSFSNDRPKKSFKFTKVA